MTLSLLAAQAKANVRLPAIISDHMVLQRDVPVPVWGWADPGELVRVHLAGQEKTATADAGGKWMTKLDPLKVGDPQTMTVQGRNTITIQDVLVGEVWLASGQSNMDFGLGWERETENTAFAAALEDSQLRSFNVPQKGSLEPQDDVVGQWQLATPANARGWSAVGTYFCKNLRDKLGVPVGFIRSSFGGTAAEPWTSIEALDHDPVWKEKAAREAAAARDLPEALKVFPGKVQGWATKNGAQDPGNVAMQMDWAAPGFNDSDWKEVEIPSPLQVTGVKAGGIIWYRKSFVLPPTATGEFNFEIGSISNGVATVFFNGTEVKPAVPYENFMRSALRVHVPKELVHPGQSNLLAVRLYALAPSSTWGVPATRMNLPVAVPKMLDNHWKFHVAMEFPPLTPAALTDLPSPPTASLSNTSSALFNSMINPLIPYAIKGTIWYQGESNANSPEHALEYRRLLPTLIGDWRKRWSEGNFPFYIVQLANYTAAKPQPSESNWAILRESQNAAASAASNSGVAVIIDIGEASNIHPRNKKDVGWRLSLLALNRTYGRKIPDSGPVFERMKIEGAAVRLSFTQLNGGLDAKGGPLTNFSIAGADKKFVWADARIDGDTIVVSSTQVPNPVAVRYAWADNPEGCNLYNKAGLPASPFRTDMP